MPPAGVARTRHLSPARPDAATDPCRPRALGAARCAGRGGGAPPRRPPRGGGGVRPVAAPAFAAGRFKRGGLFRPVSSDFRKDRGFRTWVATQPRRRPRPSLVVAAS